MLFRSTRGVEAIYARERRAILQEEEQKDAMNGRGARMVELPLTNAARHVREETRILPLDSSYRLVVLRLHHCRSLCFPLHGNQD